MIEMSAAAPNRAANSRVGRNRIGTNLEEVESINKWASSNSERESRERSPTRRWLPNSTVRPRANISDSRHTRWSRYTTNDSTKEYSNISAMARRIVGHRHYRAANSSSLDRVSDPADRKSPVVEAPSYKTSTEPSNRPDKPSTTSASETSYSPWNPSPIAARVAPAATDPGSYSNEANDVLETVSSIDWKSNWNSTIPKLASYYSNNTAEASVYDAYSAHTNYLWNVAATSSMLHRPRSRSNVVPRVEDRHRIAKNMKRMSNPNSEANAIGGADDADLASATSTSVVELERSRSSRGDRDIMSPPSNYLAYRGSIAARSIDPTAHVGTT